MAPQTLYSEGGEEEKLSPLAFLALFPRRNGTENVSYYAPYSVELTHPIRQYSLLRRTGTLLDVPTACVPYVYKTYY